MTSLWTAAHVAAAAARALPAAPRIARGDVITPLPGFDLWDYWPVQTPDGDVAALCGGALFVFLAAPRGADPDERHGRARMRLLFHRDGWRDLGWALPDALSPGSREWSGSAVAEGGRLRLFFTAAGRRGEATPSFEQRLFETSARLTTAGALPELTSWTAPTFCAEPDDAIYQRDLAGTGGSGGIKAFRDPYYFRDADGSEHLLFAASLAGSASAWNGVVGAARREGGAWRLLPPLLSADGLCNELERPHVIRSGGRLYLFWSTQAQVFAQGRRGWTGLYGMAADRLTGPWTPLNGDGLVFANPADAPHQAYSWQVLPDGRVLGFADMVGAARWPATPAEARALFSGGPAPALRLAMRGDRVALA